VRLVRFHAGTVEGQFLLVEFVLRVEQRFFYQINRSAFDNGRMAFKQLMREYN
jgi:hypothetical protein